MVGNMFFSPGLNSDCFSIHYLFYLNVLTPNIGLIKAGLWETEVVITDLADFSSFFYTFRLSVFVPRDPFLVSYYKFWGLVSNPLKWAVFNEIFLMKLSCFKEDETDCWPLERSPLSGGL
ncbi:hypothetical protein ILYODFUR_018853 [Ilyodon furcidens]|uniref:Uncharacterized protein n=1 Tax=Ilyodon furcidens TaxID=33524 RepID=A0ABV0UIM8_9TELE